MYSVDNECLVCNAYQFGTPGYARADTRRIARKCEALDAYAERQRADSSAVISLTADFASPKSIEVFGSK